MYDITDFGSDRLKIEHVENDNYIVTVDVLDVNNDYVQLDLCLKNSGAVLSDDGQISIDIEKSKKLHVDNRDIYDQSLSEINKYLFSCSKVFFCPVTPDDFAKKACIMAEILALVSNELNYNGFCRTDDSFLRDTKKVLSKKE